MCDNCYSGVELTEKSVHSFRFKEVLFLPSVCFTGHRPPRINEENTPFIRTRLTETIAGLIDEGYDTFISGMALGVDMLAAEIVLEFRKTNPSVRLECAVPCRGQSNRWKAAEKKRHADILAQADKVTYVSEKFTPFCMQLRNAYMVDNSEVTVAVYDGGEGGTANTIAYARRRNKRIITIPCGGDDVD